MSYKPKHCNECGEKIERANWGLTTSRRFCDLCGTNFGHLDWIPRIAVCAAIIFAIALVGFAFRKTEKDLIISTGQSLPNSSTNGNKNIVSQTNAAAGNANSAIVQSENVNSTAQRNMKPAAFGSVAQPSEKIKSAENQPSAAASAETVYFCGAQTKKGTPCTRRVKGGGRCWQHENQAAMMSPEKLLAN